MVNTIRFETEEDKLNHLQSLTNIPSINPRSYNPNDEYHRLDYINHPEYGVGFVEEVISETEMRAYFNEGVVVLPKKSFLNKKVI
jgi:hypothetical protein